MDVLSVFYIDNCIIGFDNSEMLDDRDRASKESYISQRALIEYRVHCQLKEAGLIIFLSAM